MESIRDMMENAFYTGLGGRVENVVTEKKVVKTASVKEEIKGTSHDVRDAMSDAFCASLDTNIKLAEAETQKMIKKAQQGLPIRKVVKKAAGAVDVLGPAATIPPAASKAVGNATGAKKSSLFDIVKDNLGNMGYNLPFNVIQAVQNKLNAAGFTDTNIPAPQDIKAVYEKNKAQLMSGQGKQSLQQGATGAILSMPTINVPK